MELNPIVTELKNSIESFNIRLDQARERINELEDRSFEIILSEEQKEKRMKRNEESLQNLWDTIKRSNLCIIIGVIEEKKGRKG